MPPRTSRSRASPSYVRRPMAGRRDLDHGRAGSSAARPRTRGRASIILDSYGGAHQRDRAGRDGLRAPRRALLVPVRRLLERRRAVHRAVVDLELLPGDEPVRVGYAYQNYIDPDLAELAGRLLRRQLRPPGRRQEAGSTRTTCSASARASRSSRSGRHGRPAAGAREPVRC